MPMLKRGLWLLAGLFYACAPPPVMRQDWTPEQGFEGLLQLSAGQLEQVEDLTAEAGISVRSAEGRDSGTALILLKRPDLFRFEIRGPLYSHIFTALLQGDSLTVDGSGIGGSWKGAVDGWLLRSLTGVDLDGYDLRYALLGIVAPGRIDSTRSVEYLRADRAIVALAEDGRTRRIWVDLHRGLVVREVIESDRGEVLLSRQLRDYRRIGDLYLPGRVVIEQRGMTIELEYRQYRLDRGIADKHFFQGFQMEQVRRVD